MNIHKYNHSSSVASRKVKPDPFVSPATVICAVAFAKILEDPISIYHGSNTKSEEATGRSNVITGGFTGVLEATISITRET